MTTTTVSGVSLNITGLQNFTNYRVSVQASNAPVVDYGPTLSGVFPTLPEAEIPPGGEVPTIVVPQVGDRSSGIVEIIIPSPPFERQDFLRYVHQCSASVYFLLIYRMYIYCMCVLEIKHSLITNCRHIHTYIVFCLMCRYFLSLSSCPTLHYLLKLSLITPPHPLQSPVGGVHQEHSPNN